MINFIKKADLFGIALLLSGPIGIGVIISSALFFFKIPVTNAIPLISLVLCLCIFFFSYKTETLSFFLSNILLTIVIYAIALFISYLFFDVSGDGRGYHQSSIYLIKSGWNLVYEKLPKSNLLYTTWSESYPKSIELSQALIYSLFENIELAKSINITFFIVSLLITYKVLLLTELNKITILLFTFLICFNPIVLSQLISFMIDGVIYSLLVSSVGLGILYLNNRKNKLILLLFVLNSIMLLSSKYTNLAVVGIFSLFFSFYSLIFEKNITKFIRNSLICSLIFIIGLGIVNFNPYFTNIINNKHPLHPVFGNEKVDILTQFRPKELDKCNRFEQFIISTFSRTGSPGIKLDKFKYPFMIYKKELNRLSDTDIGFGGFGVFYGLFLIILILTTILSHVFFRINNKYLLYVFLYIGVMIFISVFIIPETWWMRIISHFWLLPILILLSNLLVFEKTSKLSYLPISVLLLNIFIFLPFIFILNLYYTLQVNHELNQFKTNKENVIEISKNIFPPPSVFFKLKENGLKYEYKKNFLYDEKNCKYFLPPSRNKSFYKINEFKELEKNIVYYHLDKILTKFK